MGDSYLTLYSRYKHYKVEEDNFMTGQFLSKTGSMIHVSTIILKVVLDPFREKIFDKSANIFNLIRF